MSPAPDTRDPASRAEPILRVEGLTAGYDGKVLLRDGSFCVRRGQIFVILAGSGSGSQSSTDMRPSSARHQGDGVDLDEEPVQ